MPRRESVGSPKKPKYTGQPLRIRCSEEQRARYAKAAEAAQRDESDWARIVLDAECDRLFGKPKKRGK